jgi:UDPglucose 6-dehydrogenase
VIVLGGKNDEFMKRLKKFYQRFSSQVPITMTNHQTAEIIKYANNSFLATKISFINQIANICEAIPGANVEDVAKTIGLDPRIGKLFLNAGPGYGGSCLPKDVKAIINFSVNLGINPNLLNAVEEVNKNQLKNTIATIENAIGKIKGRRITILGLAFKPETDDIRDSVSIKLIEILLRKGAKIIAHDPKAIENTKLIFGERISYEKSMRRALKGTDCAIILTPWKQYTHLSEVELKLMKKRVIVDCRRLLSGQKLNADYHAIGIGKS